MEATKRTAVSIAFCGISMLLSAPTSAQQPAGAENGWEFTLMPYLWLPNVNGTLNLNTPSGAGGSPQVEVGADKYLHNLEMAAMLSGEARKGTWAIITDVIYLDFSSESAEVKTVSGPGGIVQVPINADSQAGLKGLVWNLAASYTVSQSDTSRFEILGGFRYMGLETTLNWQLASPLGLFPQSGNFSQKDEFWDAIVGVRGKLKLGGSNWFVPYHLDAGTGSSELTWQAMAGIGYAWKWGDVLLAYRHLSYEQEEGKLVQDLQFGGPGLGVAFHF